MTADAVRYKSPQQVSLIRQTASGRSGSVLRAGIEKRSPALTTAVLGERGVAYQTEIEFRGPQLDKAQAGGPHVLEQIGYLTWLKRHSEAMLII